MKRFVNIILATVMMVASATMLPQAVHAEDEKAEYNLQIFADRRYCHFDGW